MKTLTLFIIFSLAVSAQARLGDVETKVAQRYGTPIQIYRDVKGRIGHIHRFNGYIIMVQYLDGISQSEVYAKEDDAQLTDSDMQAILSANASGEKWQEIPAATMVKASGPGWRGWVILRTRALSAYGPSVINHKQFQHAISVGTHAYNEQNKALDAKLATTPQKPQPPPEPPATTKPTARESDAYLILDAVATCIAEFNLDRVSSSKPVKEPTEFQTYTQHAVNQSIALKHCQTARSLLQPLLQIQDSKLRAPVQKLDASFATKERLHKQMLDMIDRITSGTGHAKMSEVGRGGADAIEALDQLTSGTTELFILLLPSLSPDERRLLASRIRSRFPDEQKIYDAGHAEGTLSEEIWVILKLRDIALGKQQ